MSRIGQCRLRFQPLLLSVPREIWLLCLVSLVLGAVYVFIAGPGLPADEPSHFQIVCYYQQHLAMPVIGQPGVSHEGQMGPVYYVISAFIYSLFKFLGAKAGFYALRLSGLVLIPPVVLLSYRIAEITCPDDILFRRLTATFMGTNSSLLAIGASVQNDYLTMALCLGAMLLCFELLINADHLVRKGALAGALISIGILTKAPAVHLVFAVPIYAFFQFRSKQWPFTVSFLATVFALTSWFFVRNYLLYGDLTAQAALIKFHYYPVDPTPIDLTRPANLVRWLWVIESYYWLPIQYYRDLFHVPLWLRAVIGICTVSGVYGTFRAIYEWKKKNYSCESATEKFALFLALQYLISMLIYTYSCVRIIHFAPRVTFSSMVAYAMIIVLGGFGWQKLGRYGARCYAIFLMATLTACNFYVLWNTAHLNPVYPFTLFVHT